MSQEDYDKIMKAYSDIVHSLVYKEPPHNVAPVVEDLLEKEININEKNEDNRTALDKVLMRHLYSTQFYDEDSKKEFTVASLDFIKTLVEHGAEFSEGGLWYGFLMNDGPDYKGCFDLMLDVAGDRESTKKTLSEILNHRFYDQENIESRKLLIEKGATLDTSQESYLKLERPLQQQLKDAVAEYHQKESTPAPKGDFEKIGRALESKNPSEEIKKLIEGGVDIAAQNEKGFSNLDLALMEADIHNIEILQKNGDSSLNQKYVQFGLSYSVMKEESNNIVYFINNLKADFEYRTEGLTPLEVAYYNGKIESAKTLVENGAPYSPSMLDRLTLKAAEQEFPPELNTAAFKKELDALTENYKKLCREELQEAVEKYHNSPLKNNLREAIENDNAAEVTKLLENGADVYSKHAFYFLRLYATFELAKPGSAVEELLQEEKKVVDSMKDVVLEELNKLSEKKEITEEEKNEAASNIANSLKISTKTEQFELIKANIKEELNLILKEQQEYSQKNYIMQVISYLMGYAPNKEKSSLKTARKLHFTKKYLASKKKDRESKKER